jgi:hypothetical protein
MKTSKTDKERIVDLTHTLNLIKNYVIPVMITLVGIGVVWTTLQGSVKSNTMAIESLGVRCTIQENLNAEILQRLAGIDAKLEFIIKTIE